MKAIIIGGGAISGKDLETFQTIEAPLYHTYGMTETLTHVALKRINGEMPDHNFKAIPGVIFSKDSRDCLVIKTPILNEEIVTNDIVNLISKKEFEYLGRLDNVINSGGYKIHPQLVEQKIELLIMVFFQTNNYFIFAEDDPNFGEHPELIIEGSLHSGKLKELQAALKRVLHPYEIPKKVHFIKSFEFTRTGKVDRVKTVANLFN